MKTFKTYIVLFVSIFLLSGNAFALLIEGTPGDDHLPGTAFGDSIYGYAGDDDLYGLGGPDQLYGGPDDDYLEGGEGIFDYCDGGAGTDTCSRTCETCISGSYAKRTSEAAEEAQNEGLFAIAGENLTRVEGGAGLTVVLFPFTSAEANLDVSKSAEEKIDIPLGTNAKGMLTVIKELDLGAEAFGKVINGSLSLSMSVADDAKAASAIFTRSDNGVTMEHPLSGNEIHLINVDYIGFADNVLIPVF